MCIFCTGAFARFAARFHSAEAETPVGNEIESCARADGAAPASSLANRPEQSDAEQPAQDARDFLNR
jgi:hypothetical protein